MSTLMKDKINTRVSTRSLKRKPLPDVEICAAVECLENLEETLWQAIFGNRAKLPLAIAQIVQLIGEEKRYEVSGEFWDLIKAAQSTGKSPKARKTAVGATKEMILQIQAIDSDRQIVSAVTDEVVLRGTRSRAGDDVSMSHYARKVLAISNDVLALRNTIIEANQGLVFTVANRFSKGSMPFYDRVQEGNLGLIKAVNRFDYKLGYKFSTYASWWIRSSIGRAIATTESTIRVPTSAQRIMKDVRRAAWEIGTGTGRAATDQEIALRAGINVRKLLQVRTCITSKEISIDDQVPGTDGLRYIDVLADETAENPGNEVERKSLLGEVNILLTTLTEIERDILEQRFGLGTEEEATLREIGRRYHLSRERIRQIQNLALKKLKDGMKLDAA
jgi:RNA polymerase primary sigma factor